MTRYRTPWHSFEHPEKRGNASWTDEPTRAINAATNPSELARAVAGVMDGCSDNLLVNLQIAVGWDTTDFETDLAESLGLMTRELADFSQPVVGTDLSVLLSAVSHLSDDSTPDAFLEALNGRLQRAEVSMTPGELADAVWGLKNLSAQKLPASMVPALVRIAESTEGHLSGEAFCRALFGLRQHDEAQLPTALVDALREMADAAAGMVTGTDVTHALEGLRNWRSHQVVPALMATLADLLAIEGSAVAATEVKDLLLALARIGTEYLPPVFIDAVAVRLETPDEVPPKFEVSAFVQALHLVRDDDIPDPIVAAVVKRQALTRFAVEGNEMSYAIMRVPSLNRELIHREFLQVLCRQFEESGCRVGPVDLARLVGVYGELGSEYFPEGFLDLVLQRFRDAEDGMAGMWLGHVFWAIPSWQGRVDLAPIYDALAYRAEKPDCLFDGVDVACVLRRLPGLDPDTVPSRLLEVIERKIREVPPARDKGDDIVQLLRVLSEKLETPVPPAMLKAICDRIGGTTCTLVDWEREAIARYLDAWKVKPDADTVRAAIDFRFPKLE